MHSVQQKRSFRTSIKNVSVVLSHTMCAREYASVCVFKYMCVYLCVSVCKCVQSMLLHRFVVTVAAYHCHLISVPFLYRCSIINISKKMNFCLPRDALVRWTHVSSHPLRCLVLPLAKLCGFHVGKHLCRNDFYTPVHMLFPSMYQRMCTPVLSLYISSKVLFALLFYWSSNVYEMSCTSGL